MRWVGQEGEHGARIDRESNTEASRVRILDTVSSVFRFLVDSPFAFFASTQEERGARVQNGGEIWRKTVFTVLVWNPRNVLLFWQGIDEDLMCVWLWCSHSTLDIENAYGAFRLAARRVGTRLPASKNGLLR